MIGWFRQLESARSPLEVVSIARDFLASWSPQDLARIPERCRPGRLRDETDIENLHGKLVEEYRVTRATDEELRLLQELTSFLVRASIRIAEFGASAPRGSAGAADSAPKRSASPES